MAGLMMQNNHAMQQWFNLFNKHDISRSPQAKHHWKQLLKLGLPSSKNANWQYTSIDQLFNHRFFYPDPLILNQNQLNLIAFKLNAIRLVFINGHFITELSDKQHDLFVIQVINASKSRQLTVPIQSEPFLHLNESLAEEITIISLGRGKIAERPIYLLNISSSCVTEGLNICHYRHHLQLDEGAQASVIEHHISLNGYAHFTGTRFTAEVKNNAFLKHYNFAFEDQGSYHFSHNDFIVHNNAYLKSDNFLLGTRLTRHNSSCQLNGEKSDVIINSFAIATKQEVCDSRTYLEHNKAYCQSRQQHKTIVSDHAKVVFNGHIKVSKHALKTDAQMSNSNLLLNHSAEVHSKPQLEIYADDVKCGHGASVGSIDEEQMFYLRSRGINKLTAQRMIIYAFASELIDTISDKIIKKEVIKHINLRFPRGL